MAWEIQTARVMVGLASDDASRDTEITATMNLSQSLAERHCGRGFLQADAIERFVHPGKRLFLHRFPIESVAYVSETEAGASMDGFTVDRALGVVTLPAGLPREEVWVSYRGGYAAVPHDLEAALWEIFGSVWEERYGADASGLGGMADAGGVKSVTLFGVGAATFSSASAPSAGGGATAEMFVNPSARVAWVLDSYRRMSA